MAATALLVAASARAHPGGLAADGCHFERSTGVRHCHGGGRGGGGGSGNASQLYAPSSAAPARTGPAYFSSCSAARAAGAAPMRVGDPGYAPRLDRDGDGIACE